MGLIETIELHADGYVDAWLCVCGNTPSSDGFYPCNEWDGVHVEPVIGGFWDGKSYVCDRCGRIIDQDTGNVTGYRSGSS